MPPRKAPNNASAAAALGGRDYISNLGVLQHMLSYLPAPDAVRTCVLAKRWRHMWKSTTGLGFVCSGTKEQIEFVEQLLRVRIREDMPLDTCEFSLYAYDDDAAEKNKAFDLSRIVLWIRIALQCKVQVLRLIMLNDYQNISPGDGHPFFISRYLKKLEFDGVNEYIMTGSFLDLSYCPVCLHASHHSP